MSASTKRKLVTAQVLTEFPLPEDPQKIVKLLGGKGNNLHEVVDEHGEAFLVSMPTKFRKNVWVKRGDYVIVDPIEEGDKVKAEISVVLYKEQIRYIKSEKQWPAAFEDGNKSVEKELEKVTLTEEKEDCSYSEEDSSEDDSDLFVNTNRPVVEVSDDDDSTEEESSDEE